jgi:hypothetical protein
MSRESFFTPHAVERIAAPHNGGKLHEFGGKSWVPASTQSRAGILDHSEQENCIARQLTTRPLTV